MIKEESETSFPKQINETQDNPSFTAHFIWLAKFISHDNTGTFLAIINGQQIKSIADTGSYRNILSIKLLEKIRGPDFKNTLLQKIFRPIYDINQNKLKILGAVHLTVKIGSFTGSDEFVVFESAEETAIFGFSFMKTYQIISHPKIGLLQQTNEPEPPNFYKKNSQMPCSKLQATH